MIPAQSSVVTVVMLPPLSAGREEEIVAPRVPRRRGAWFTHTVCAGGGRGVRLALVDLETEGGPLASPVEARALGDSRSGVLASRLSASASWPVGEWVWPDLSKPGEARFVLCDRQDEELWGRLERSEILVGNDLTTTDAGLVEVLKKIRLARRSAFVDLPNFIWVSPRGFRLHLSYRYGAICFDVFDSPALKSLEGISLNKSRFLREEHARLGRKAAVLRRVGELIHELEATWASELRKHDRATVAEQDLAVARSVLSTERLLLEVERVARALAEGQAQSKGQRVTQLEALLA
jgi:hypothetical protein